MKIIWSAKQAIKLLSKTKRNILSFKHLKSSISLKTALIVFSHLVVSSKESPEHILTSSLDSSSKPFNDGEMLNVKIGFRQLVASGIASRSAVELADHELIYAICFNITGFSEYLLTFGGFIFKEGTTELLLLVRIGGMIEPLLRSVEWTSGNPSGKNDLLHCMPFIDG